MSRGKKIYFGLLLLSIFMVSTMYFSYSFFVNKQEAHGKLNIVVGTLDYKIESEKLVNNQVTVEPNSIKEINMKIISLNNIDSKYELYYDVKKGSNVEVLYSVRTEDKVSDIIESKGTKKILIIVQNKGNDDATIEFKVGSSLVNNEIVLNTENKIEKMIDSPTVSGGGATWSTSRTFAINSNLAEISKYEYYIANNKIAPSMETKATGVTTANSTITETGTYIYFRAVDNNGTKGEWTKAGDLYVDNTKPVVTITKNANTNTLTATVTPSTTLSGYTYSWYQIPEYKYSSIAGSFMATEKQENGESYYNFNFTKVDGTKNEWYYITFPVYKFTAGNTYKIHFKYRVNSISNTSFNFRHSAIANDHATNGSLLKVVREKTNSWIDAEMTRSIPAQVTQYNATSNSAPRFEIYTDTLAIQSDGAAKSVDFDLKDVWIEEVENSDQAIPANNLAKKLADTGITYTIPEATSGNRYILKVTTGSGLEGSSNTYKIP